MSGGSPIPVWYSEEDRRRVEEAAALAGYRHLSKYIRDKTLGRDSHRNSARNSMQAWADHQELSGRLADIERSQRSTEALLAMLVFLVHGKATTAETNELIVACENARIPADILAASSSKLAAQLPRFSEEA